MGYTPYGEEEKQVENKEVVSTSLMSEKDKEMYDKAKKKLLHIMKHHDELRVGLGNRVADEMRRGSNLLISHMDTVIRTNSKPKMTNDDIKVIARTLELMMDTILFQELKPIVKDLAVEYSKIVYNWNRFTSLNDRNISRNALMISRFMEGYATSLDAINIMRKVTKKLNSTFMRQPAGFEIAKHFGAALAEEVEKHE